MTAIEGGYRDRIIIESTSTMIHDALEALGWFDANRQHRPIEWRTDPVPADEEVPYNTLVVSFEDMDASAAELGSEATENTHIGYVDFYAEPPPPEGNGGEALGKHLIGDVWAILCGRMPSIGRDRSVIEVLDYGLATPAYVFSVYVEVERTRTSKVHRAHQAWERWWYSCVFELTEERFLDDANLDAHGYAGGYEGGY